MSSLDAIRRDRCAHNTVGRCQGRRPVSDVCAVKLYDRWTVKNAPVWIANTTSRCAPFGIMLRQW
jgi:hypothetical protein